MGELKKRRLIKFLALLIALNLNMVGFFFMPDVQETRLIVLTYHHIVPENSKFIDKYNSSVSPEKLERDIAYFKKSGFHFLSMEDIYSFLVRGKPLPERSVALTFDDGYESNYIWAYPLLRKYGVKATFFVVAGKIVPVSRPYDMNKTEKLSWPQLREMYSSGYVSVQSHTYNLHYKNSDSSYALDKLANESENQYAERIYNDLSEARKLISQEVGAEVQALAWPYGRSTPTADRAATKAGYSLLWTNQPGQVSYGEDRLHLSRFDAEADVIRILETMRKGEKRVN